MKAISWGLNFGRAALVVLFAGTSVVHAIDVQQLVQETQKMSNVAQHLTMAWWIPPEFWDASLASNPNVTSAQRAATVKALEDFQIIALFRGTASISGLSEIPSRDDMAAHLKLEVSGKIIEPLALDKISPSAQTLLTTLKPLLGGMLGQLGQGMQLVLYPSRLEGKRLIDPTKPGTFQVTLYDQSFHWRLPLASLLPTKWDPASKEEFPGNFDYNPYTGGKLISK